MSAFTRMTEESLRLGLPHRFLTDLTTHDSRSISSKPASTPFVWALYEDGTHLLWVSKAGPDLVRTISADFVGVHWFIFDGTELFMCSQTEAEDFARRGTLAPDISDVDDRCGDRAHDREDWARGT